MKTQKILIILALLSPTACFADTGQVRSSAIETVISFLPVIFFLLTLIITLIKLKNDKAKLSDLLAEKDTPAPTGGGTGQNPPQSTSRFIAFLTGLVALSLGISLSTFFIYVYFTQNKTVDVTNLTTVIWGLGIGVLPYGFNKASAAVKPNS
jgi:hypothetical protein